MTNDSGIGAFFNTFIFICTTLSSTICITVGSKFLLSQIFSSTRKYGCLWWPTFLPFGHVIFCKWDLGIYSRRQIFRMTNDSGIGVLFNAFIFVCTTLSSTVCITVGSKWGMAISYFLFNFDFWSFVEIDKLINLEISNLQIGKVANRYKFSSKGWHVDSVHEGKKQLKKYNYINKTFSEKRKSA